MGTEVLEKEAPVFTRDWLTGRVENWGKFLDKFKGKDNVYGLEIGSFEGRSAIWFCENVLTGVGCRLTCVDAWFPTVEMMAFEINWKDAEARFDENIRRAGLQDKILKSKGISFEVLASMIHNTNFRWQFDLFDFVYIDGSHRADHVIADAVMSWRLLKDGGIMIFDDYKSASYPASHMNCKSGIDAFLATHGYQWKMLLPPGEQVVIEKQKVQYSLVGKDGKSTRATNPDGFILEDFNAEKEKKA